MMLRAGTADFDVTPPVGYRLQGHAKRICPSASVHDPLMGRVLTLSDGSRRVAIVTLDLLYFLPTFYDRVRRRVREKHGVAEDALVLACSHTHTGPFVIPPTDEACEDYLEDYVSLLEKKLCGAVGQAIGEERACQLRFASGEVDIGIVNRRVPTARGVRTAANPGGPVDLTCPVVRVDDAAGRPMAAVFQYACHPTTLGATVDAISADYPGAACRVVEANYPGCTAMFLNGCCGEVRPRIVNEQGDFVGGGFDDVQRLGWLLAAHVMACMENAKPMQSTTLESRLARHRYAFDPELMPVDDASMQRCRSVLGERNPGETAAIAQWSERWRDRCVGQSSLPTDYIEGDVQVLRVGDASLVALTGEVMVDVALSLRERSPSPLLIAGYAQGAIGYIPTRQALLEGGYETQAYLWCDYPGCFAGDVAERLVERVRSML
ncbi:neutral/alkaline non-lysosomal ceramidase N-terminal domain-containing protein [Phycisphaerales bacterium AB-hyl4]|uniref:Neutral/alkaline non-lysosomal ceramidase N-terminal domain-containing protein n=1 Tax=Natronomicrosphaera hydrolytica TaxID=3242702 RepID=A0ABV4U935_9BACT